MRQESEWNPKNVDVLRLKQFGFHVGYGMTLLCRLVTRAAQSAPDNLLAKQLARKCPQAHDLRHRFGIPPFRQHPNGNDILDLLTRLANLAHRIDYLAQLLRLLSLGQFLLLWLVLIVSRAVLLLRLAFLLLRLRHFEHL